MSDSRFDSVFACLPEPPYYALISSSRRHAAAAPRMVERAAQTRADRRAHWYDHDPLRVAKVERAYGMNASA